MDFDKDDLSGYLLPSTWLTGSCAISIVIFLCVGVVIDEKKRFREANYEFPPAATKQCMYSVSYPRKYRLTARKELLIQARKTVSGCGHN